MKPRQLLGWSIGRVNGGYIDSDTRLFELVGERQRTGTKIQKKSILLRVTIRLIEEKRPLFM